jgi:urease accessory protein
MTPPPGRDRPTSPARGEGRFFLAALQLGDSLFPSGAFTQSSGLETLVADGEVADPNGLRVLLRTHLLHRLARADLPVLLAAHAAVDLDIVLEADRLLAAVKLAREERTASARTGRRIAAEAARLAPEPVLLEFAEAAAGGATPGNAAVAQGLAARAFGIPAEPAALLACYTFGASLVAAALRLMRAGHGDAQAVLRDCRPDMEAAVEIARAADWRDPRPCAPRIDIASARHERAPARMFAS